ncbi:MAG: acylphosphatase [Gemmatimonadetes bacterium]|nr:acylphosphatase [Gemmatimonadota bacterium]
MSSIVRREIVFRGRVQGVFFRATTQRIARGFDVTGWVRNEPDGSVRCVVEGAVPEVDRFLAAVQDAKRDNIDRIESVESPATDEYETFTVSH